MKRRIAAIVILAASLLAQSCALFDSPKRTVKTIADVASVLCDIFAMEHEHELGGISPAEFCSVADNVSPFLAQAKLAASAGGELALKKGNP